VEEAGPSTEKEQIFVSYGRRDGAEAAEELCALLESRGYRVWWDQRDISAGAVFTTRIQAGIEGSDLLVAILTPWSVRHESWCLDELAHARNTEVPILPVCFVAGVLPPFPIARLSAIDVSGDREAALAEVLAQVQTALETGRSPLREFGDDAPWCTRVERLDFDADLGRHIGKFVGREWLFDLLRERVRDPDTRVILLTGAAGIGKTAIAAQASVRLNVRGVHLCRRSMPRSCRPESWLSGLVHQLALQFPAYRGQLESMPEPDWQDTRGLFRRVVAGPLAQVESSLDVSEPLVFVVDGLDEAVALEGHGMSRAIRDAVADFPPWLRVIVTSRPDQGLKESFALRHVRVDEIEADTEPNLADVRAYVESRVGQLAEISDDPGQRVALVRWIVEAVEGNFLVASMTLDELAERGLDAFKGPDTEALFPRDAKGLYTQMFEDRFEVDEYRQLLRPLLEALVVARSPLPDDLLCRTVASRYDAEDGISALSQFLQTGADGHVLFHKSLADWLVGHARGTPYRILAEHGHRKLAELCEAEYSAGVRRMSSYALRHLPAHLMRTGDWARAIQVLDDEAFRQARSDQGFDDETIADLEMAERERESLTPEQGSTLTALWTKAPGQDDDEPEEPDGRPGAEEALKKLVSLLGQGASPTGSSASAAADPGKSPNDSAEPMLAMLQALSRAGKEGGRPEPAMPPGRDLGAANELLLSHVGTVGITRDVLEKAIVTPAGQSPPDLDDPAVLHGVLRTVIERHLPDLDVDEILRTRRPPEDPVMRLGEAKAKLDSVQARLEEKAKQKDFAGARRIVEELAEYPELAEVQKAWDEQLDEAERSVRVSRLLERVVARVQEAVAGEDFEGARAAVDALPSDHKETKAFRLSILKQIDEAEDNARIKARLEPTIEKAGALVEQGRVGEARAEIQGLPDEPQQLLELKEMWLAQLDGVEGRGMAPPPGRPPATPPPGDVQVTPSRPASSVRPPDAGPANPVRKGTATCPSCGSPIGGPRGTRAVGVVLGLSLAIGPLVLLRYSWWFLLLVVPTGLLGVVMAYGQAIGFTTCRECGWSGRPSRKATAPAESSGNSRGGWVQSAELRGAVDDAQLGGVVLALRKVEIAGGGMLFAFELLEGLPAERSKEAGLALRCVVAQTLIQAARLTPGVALGDELAYRVTLSDGVVLSAPKLESGDQVTDPLQVTGGVVGPAGMIVIQPIGAPASRTPTQEAANKHVVEQLLPFFEARVGSSLVLG